jgi:hypothetical protein
MKIQRVSLQRRWNRSGFVLLFGRFGFASFLGVEPTEEPVLLCSLGDPKLEAETLSLRVFLVTAKLVKSETH